MEPTQKEKMMRPIVEKEGTRIHLRSDYGDKDKAKAIPGARWSKSVRRWTYPLDLETCRRLRDEFGEQLQIGPELWAWASAQKGREEHLTSLTDLSKIDLTAVVDMEVVPKVAPTMWAAMQQRPYQPVAALYMARAKRCLNADQPGIGKTIETLAALIEQRIQGPVLILAPRTSCLVVWPAEIEKWLGRDVPYTITQSAGLTPVQREKVYDRYRLMVRNSQPDAMHFFIANAEQAGIKVEGACPAEICNGAEDWCPALAEHTAVKTVKRPFLHDTTWEAIVADETHKWLINTRGKRASQVGYGFTRLRVRNEESPMYALSGTPLKGKKWNLFGTLNWIWPRVYTSKWRWIESYFEVVKDKITVRGGLEKEVKEITGEWASAKAEQAFYRSLATVMIRRTKDELRAINPAWMPPEKQYHDVWVEMDPKQRRHYQAMEKDAAAVLEGGRLSASGVLAEMTRLKQFASSDGKMVDGEFVPTMPSAKFDWLVQFLDERGIERKVGTAKHGDLSEEVHKVVVASQYTELINMWAEALRDMGIKCYVLTGQTPDRQREQINRAFQMEDAVRVFFINTNAGGVSITLDSADDIVLMDETWVPDEQEQVEDRVHRASNVKHQVDVWYIRTKDSIEEGIAKTNADKAMANHIVLDAQRGLKFAAERFGTIIAKEKE